MSIYENYDDVNTFLRSVSEGCFSEIFGTCVVIEEFLFTMQLIVFLFCGTLQIAY